MRAVIPNSLHGGTVLDAHNFVSNKIIRNGGNDRGDYYLRNPRTGKTVGLTDLTKGQVTEVEIEFSDDGARSNPAPSYAFKAGHAPAPRRHNRDLTALLPGELSPSLVYRMVTTQGLFSGVNTLSKMLNRQMRPAVSSPITMQLMAARAIPAPAGSIRTNPLGRSSGPMIPMNVIAGRREVIDDMVDNRIKEYLSESGYSVDGFDMSDPDYARPEYEQIVDDHRMPSHYTANKQTFQRFMRDVLQPYLLTASANQALIQYLHRTAIPHMKRLIEEGRFTMDEFQHEAWSIPEGKWGTVKGLAEKATKRRKGKKEARSSKSLNVQEAMKHTLSLRYDFLIERLVTSPADFLHGRDYALLAHPGFLYRELSLALLPLPKELTGDTILESFLLQGGEEPRYGRTKDGTPVVKLPDGMPVVITRISTDVAGSGTTFGKTLNADFVMKLVTEGKILQLFDAASSVFGHLPDLDAVYGEVGGFQSDAMEDIRHIARELYSQDRASRLSTFAGINDDDDPSERPVSIAIEADIPGLKPTPLGWPDELVYGMMQAILDNSDHITGLGANKSVDEAGISTPIDWLTPSITSKFQFDPQASIQLDLPLDPPSGGPNAKAWEPILKYKVLKLSDLISTTSDGSDWQKVMKASLALHYATNVGASHLAFEENHPSTNKDWWKNTANVSPNLLIRHTAKDGRLTKFVHIANKQGANMVSLAVEAGSLSVIQVLKMAVSNAVEKGYNPESDDVAFVFHLLIYSLSNMSQAKFEPFKQEGALSKIAAVMGERNENKREEAERVREMLKSAVDELAQDAVSESGDPMEADIIMALLAEELKKYQSSTPNMFAEGEVTEEAGVETDTLADFDEEGEPLTNPAGLVEAAAAEWGPDRDQARRDRLSTTLTKTSLDDETINAVLAHIEKRKLDLGKKYSNLDDARRSRLVSQMSQSLGNIFREAVAQSVEERRDAAEARRAQERITDLLGEMNEVEADAASDMVIQQQTRTVSALVKTMLDGEIDLVNMFAELLPGDARQKIPTEVKRSAIQDHFLMRLINSERRFEAYLRELEYSEGMLQNALIAHRASAIAGDLDAHEQMIKIIQGADSLIDALQQSYKPVHRVIEAAIDKMSDVDSPDTVDFRVYQAAFMLESAYDKSLEARDKLRLSSVTSSTPIYPQRAQDAYTALRAKLWEFAIDFYDITPDASAGFENARTITDRLVERRLHYGDEDIEDVIIEVIDPENRKVLRELRAMDPRQTVGWLDDDTVLAKVMRDTNILLAKEVEEKKKAQKAARRVAALKGHETRRLAIEKAAQEEDERKAEVKKLMAGPGLKGFEEILRKGPQILSSLERRLERRHRDDPTKLKIMEKIEGMVPFTPAEQSRFTPGTPGEIALMRESGYSKKGIEAMRAGRQRSAEVRTSDAEARRITKAVTKAIAAAPKGSIVWPGGEEQEAADIEVKAGLAASKQEMKDEIGLFAINKKRMEFGLPPLTNPQLAGVRWL